MEKILIVDDIEQNLYMLRVLLQASGYQIETAANGQGALAKARASPPDMAISDILMPVMDGFTLCREWKKDDVLKKIPFIFYTATYTDSKDEEFAMSLGAERFIRKPEEPDKFVRILHEVIEENKEGRLRAPREPLKEEEFYFRRYNQALIRKLEDKMVQLQQANRALKALKECNQALVRASDESVLLNEICRIIVETGGYRLVWVGFAEQNEKKTVRPMAQVGFEEGYLETVNITWADTEWGRGPTGTAIRAGRPSICRDILTDPNFSLWRAEAIQRGYASSIALPLIADDRSFGVLNIYSIKPDAFDQEEVNLLKEMADDLAFGIVALRTDIERKRAEEALKESEEYLKNLFDSIGAGIIIIDPETHNIIDINSFALEIIGVSKEQILNRVCHKYICPAELGKCPITDLKQTVDCLERVLIKGNSERIPILKSVVPVIREGRRYLIESFINITERKRAEQEIRTVEEQLRQSQKMEAIGSLAGGIAHDFNNLLTIMKAHSQLALMELKEGDPFRESFEEIEKATTRSANLVRQILAFSRRQVMQMIVLDLNNLLKNLEKMLRRIIGEDIELLTVLADDLGRVKTDPGQIEQVVFNLAVNARDAMPSGGKLTIETANVELDEAYARNHFAVKPGRYVMIAVSDTGVGMTPEIRERVFEPFFTTKEKGKGTGLGLATVYGIVKQSGGNIWIYSEPGQGTTLKIYLPRVEELLTEEKEKEESGLFRGVGVILVVEDEEEVRKMVVKMLKKQGYSVLEADDEEEALLLCQQHKDTIHLMVTDVVMPRISGPELAKRLVVFHPEMKVLYMSGYADNAIVHHGVLKEGVNFIQKPFTIDGLTKKVREVLEKDPKPAI